eukprot:1109337-Amphidinium_carterae.2
MTRDLEGSVSDSVRLTSPPEVRQQLRQIERFRTDPCVGECGRHVGYGSMERHNWRVAVQ